jgi:replicative DNA helicase
VKDFDRDLTLERNLLGAVLLFGVAQRCRDHHLDRGCFSLPAHAQIWDACERISDAGGEANLVTVAADLRGREARDPQRAQRHQTELDEAGGDQSGLAYLNHLTDVTTVGKVGARGDALLWMVVRLMELSGARELRALTTRFHGAVETDPDVLSDGSVDAFCAALENIRTRQPKGALWHTAEAQWSALTADVRLRETGSVWLGLEALDEAIGGLAPGEVCGVMARPGMGKTVALCHQARYLASFGMGHVFVSLEMPVAQITRRLVQAEYRLSRNQLEERLRTGEVAPDTFLERFPKLTVIDQGGLSIAEIGRRLRQLERAVYASSPIRCVTIDHLGLVGGDPKLATYDRVSKQVREIKELAKRHEVSVVVAIQVNREAGGDGSKELHLGSARDSGVVEEAVDYLLGMRRFDRSESLSASERQDYRDVMFVKVIKSRHGTPGDEHAFRFDYTLDLQPVSMGPPSSVAQAGRAHFGSARR